jgi:hypothetical protein
VNPVGQYIDARSVFAKETRSQIRGEDRYASKPENLIVLLKSWLIEDQLLGAESDSPDQTYLISTVAYDLFVDGNWHRDLHANVRQNGVNYETDPIEFTTPETEEYKGSSGNLGMPI